MTASEQLTQEIVGTFPSPEALENAVAEITSAGWDRSELSILAQHSVLGEEHVPGDSGRLADDPQTDHQAVVTDTDVRQGRTLAAGTLGVVAAFVASGATILTGGTALAAIVGAAVAGGGAAAVVEGAASVAGQKRNDFMREQLAGGGMLLWVKIDDPAEGEEARTIMTRHGATNIHMHPVASEYADDPEGKAGPKAV